MFNEFFLLQIFSILMLIYFINSVNILTLWYIAGMLLLNLGFILLNDDGDIFIGFLWVIDLGVGLIFFIFILHFLTFLYQKASFNLLNRFLFFFYFFFIFFLFFFYFFSNPNSFFLNTYSTVSNWFFFISSYNYYTFFNLFTITDLNLLREIYFYNNSFAFFIINFMLFYGIFLAINLTFMLKKIFFYLNFSQIQNLNILSEVNVNFFIRTQNFLKQQNSSIGVRVWLKKKYLTLNDF